MPVLALDTYVYGIKKYIGAYIAALGGVDVIAFRWWYRREKRDNTREGFARDLSGAVFTWMP